jgi:tetratricopeptide (TPR) repeat protein
LLNGRLGKIDEAKSDIHQAIRMYENIGFGQGVAVSEINLAEVYFMTQNYMESEALFSKSKAFWKSNGDLGRVFTNNMLGIQIYAEIGDIDKAGKLIKENEEIMNQTELDGFIKNRFNELINSIDYPQ